MKTNDEATQPSDAAVEAAARSMQPTAANHEVGCPTYNLRPFAECICAVKADVLARARAALEAAYEVDRVDAPKPLLDREALEVALKVCGIGSYRTIVADAVMELARPMPTREEIKNAASEACPSHAYDSVPFDLIAGAVLALLDGAGE